MNNNINHKSTPNQMRIFMKRMREGNFNSSIAEEIAPKKDAKGKAAQKPAPADKDSTVKVAGKAKAKTLVTAKVAVIPTKAKPVAKSATKASAKAKPEAKPVKSTPKRK